MNNDNYYLIIGSTFLKKDFDFAEKKYYKKNVMISNAIFEHKLLKGFEGVEGKVIFISTPIVGRYPFTSKRLFVKGFHSDETIQSVNYCCLYGFINYFKRKAIIRRLKKILKVIPQDAHIHIIASEVHKPYLKAVQYVKEKHPNTFSTLIAPDLADDLTCSKTFIYKWLKKKDIKHINSLIDNYIDSFFCLTKALNQKLNRFNKPFIIYPGIFDGMHVYKTRNKDSFIHCGFFGKTDIRNGINVIIEASKLLPKTIIFDIYGSGEEDEHLKNLNIDNLRYHGFINPSESYKCMEDIDIFLSPRFPEGNYINYSFPSKILDYIAFFKPIITYRLPCYDEKLDEILIYPKDLSIESFVSSIKEAIGASVDKDKYISYLEKIDSHNIVSDILNMGIRHK